MPNIRRLALVALALTPTFAHAQALKWADSARVVIESAALSGDASRLHEARALVERALAAYPNDALLLHYQGYALYREASQLVGQRRMAEAAPLLGQAAASLEASAKKKPMAETSALLAMIYGQQIAADPSQAMTLGMLAGETMGEATGLGPTNPRVALLRGMSALFTPAQYGGGVAPAREHFTDAIAFFDKDHPAPGMPAWGRAEAHVWLAQALLQGGDTTRAVAELRQALAIEPGYTWVKAGLLPPLLKVTK